MGKCTVTDKNVLKIVVELDGDVLKTIVEYIADVARCLAPMHKTIIAVNKAWLVGHLRRCFINAEDVGINVDSFYFKTPKHEFNGVGVELMIFLRFSNNYKMVEMYVFPKFSKDEYVINFVHYMVDERYEARVDGMYIVFYRTATYEHSGIFEDEGVEIAREGCKHMLEMFREPRKYLLDIKEVCCKIPVAPLLVLYP